MKKTDVLKKKTLNKIAKSFLQEQFRIDHSPLCTQNTLVCIGS